MLRKWSSAHIGPIPNMQAALTYLDSTLHSETFASSSLTVYPNPSSGLVYITGAVVNDRIELTDLRGVVVFRSNVTSAESEKLDISEATVKRDMKQAFLACVSLYNQTD